MIFPNPTPSPTPDTHTNMFHPLTYFTFHSRYTFLSCISLCAISPHSNNYKQYLLCNCLTQYCHFHLSLSNVFSFHIALLILFCQAEPSVVFDDVVLSVTSSSKCRLTFHKVSSVLYCRTFPSVYFVTQYCLCSHIVSSAILPNSTVCAMF